MTALEKAMFKSLAFAITGLTQELALTREERKRALATKQDIRDSELKIIEAIGQNIPDQRELQAVLRRAETISRRTRRLARQLSALDAAT